MTERDSAEERGTEDIGGRVMEWAVAQREHDDRQKPLIWERITGAPRGPRPTLTHDRIARAAIEIADADGLDAVSMRKLADRLGVATMGLYRYVSGKDEVVQLMIDAAHAGITLPVDPRSGWCDVARAVAEHTRAAGLRHPWLNQAFAMTPYSMTPNTLAMIERALTSLDGLGLDVDTMMAALTTVISFVRGSVTTEVAQRELMRREGWTSEDDMRDAWGPHVSWLLSTGRYPTLGRYIIEGSNEDDAEWGFEFGLECVLDGIAARLGI